MRLVRYYVYENRQQRLVRIHDADCGHCQAGYTCSAGSRSAVTCRRGRTRTRAEAIPRPRARNTHRRPTDPREQQGRADFYLEACDWGGAGASAMTTTTEAKLLTAADLLQLDAAGMRGELIRGVLCETMPTGHEHGKIVTKLVIRLGNFVEPRELGTLVTSDSGVWLERDPDAVCEPDIAFTSGWEDSTHHRVCRGGSRFGRRGSLAERQPPRGSRQGPHVAEPRCAPRLDSPPGDAHG